MVAQILSEARRITSELAGTEKNFGERETAPYLFEISHLLFQAAGKPQSHESDNALFDALRRLSYRLKPGKLNSFFGGAHGVQDIFERDNATPLSSEGALLYNAVHFGGAAELIGGENPFPDSEFSFNGKRVVIRNGKIKLTPWLLETLIKQTPHWRNSPVRDQLKLNVCLKGKPEVSFGQLFTVLRSASNSLRSLELNKILFNFNAVLNDPKKLERAVGYLSSDEALRKGIAEMQETKDVERVFGYVKSGEFGEDIWRFHNVLPPSVVQRVLDDLKQKRFEKFKPDHYLVLAEASGFSPRTAGIVHAWFHSAGPETDYLQEGLRRAGDKTSLTVNVSSRGARVHDTGFGKFYSDIAHLRKYQGGGTSGFLQTRAATITRKFSRAGTKTRLTFKK